MSFKQDFIKYCKLHKELERLDSDIHEFFSAFDLEYAATYCAGDGTMILDCIDSLCGYINEDQLNRLSKSKTRDQALAVLKEINYDR